MNTEVAIAETTGKAHHLSLGKSIAIAEGASSAISLGTVWMIGHHPKLIEPAKQFLAKHIIGPAMGTSACGCSTPSQEEIDAKTKAAEKSASVFLKGVIMVGTSFLTHIPTQMALEGRCDMKEFQKVFTGKAIGLTAAMSGLAAIKYLKPGLIENFENKLSDRLISCENAKSLEECEANREVCKLMMIDIPSSILAGLVNYQLTKRL